MVLQVFIVPLNLIMPNLQEFKIIHETIDCGFLISTSGSVLSPKKNENSLPLGAYKIV